MARAAASTAEAAGAGRTGLWAIAGSPPFAALGAGSQAESAGRIRLTGPPGGPKLAATASAARLATVSGLSADFAHSELGVTRVAMSEFSGAS
jgi:hypothetical protein